MNARLQDTLVACCHALSVLTWLFETHRRNYTFGEARNCLAFWARNGHKLTALPSYRLLRVERHWETNETLLGLRLFCFACN